MKRLLIIAIILSFNGIATFAQTYNMSSSATYHTCSGNFYDAGGPTGDYISSQDVTVTFYPTDTINQKLSVNFTSFSTYNSNDWLKVYNGSSTAAPQIAYLFDNVGAGSIISTASNGSLTFRFYASSGNPAAGWAASISCVAALSIPASGNIAMMSSGIYKTCSANFYDAGGPTGDYISPYQDVTVTFYPTDTINQKLSVNFTSFSTYNSNDWLKVYNGSSTAGLEIAYLHGTVTSDTMFISTASNGSLTFRFVASSGGTSAGWAATISCLGRTTNFIYPKLFITKAVLNIGESQFITGSDFSLNGTIQLTIKDEFDELVANAIPITYINPGRFSYLLAVTSSFKHGEYQVYATDILTGINTPAIKFRVNNPIQQKLLVTEPTTTGGYIVNSLLQIRWVDFISNSNATGVTGFVQKRYKIESSQNGGTSWQTIVSNKVFQQVQSNQTNDFFYNYAFAQAGAYIIRITDLDNTSDNNTSGSFTVIPQGGGGFTHSLEWDKSILPLPTNMPNPIGLAADGTSRILIKLSKDAANTKAVKNIHASILDPKGINNSRTDTLGKIKPARITAVYNNEANNANTTVCDTVFTSPSNNPDFSFWLVAPDDFTQTANSIASERVIKVAFAVTYSDNTTNNITVNDIKIVRPPLMMVHGLNGSSESFAKAQFDIGNGPTNFKNVINNRTIWKYGNLPNLINYESFDRNAVELLGRGSNSIRSLIDAMRNNGYAANRVDYVCHSMGGSMARTVINKYPSHYFSSKNYYKGFINKLITLNTPHNGSPIADLVVDLTPNSGWYWPAYQPNKTGMFVQRTSNILGSHYVPSPAMLDLRAVNGGVRFNVTNVKNHMIGGDIDRYNVPDAFLIAALNGNNLTKGLLTLFGLMIPSATSTSDDIINSTNNYISLRYGYPNYLSNSDLVVPVSSQFPNLNINSIPEVEDNTTIYPAFNSYGLNRNHLQITNDISVGTKVIVLLNSSINSNYFANQIAANPKTNGSAIYRSQNAAAASDSILNYLDSIHVKIVSPTNLTKLYVDSTINIHILVNDTVGLLKVQLFFQEDIYESSSKLVNQTFNLKIQSNAIGYNMLLVRGLYDSLGYTIYHSDTTILNVVSADTLKDFYISPKSQNLNSNQVFQPTYNAVYTNYVGVLNNNIDSLSFKIADINVVTYVDSVNQFVTKDTGSTYIVFFYRGLIDTAFVYLSQPQEEILSLISGDTVVCQNASVTYSVEPIIDATSYTWTLPSGWTGTSTTNSITTAIGASSGTITVEANFRYGGSSSIQTMAVSVNQVPAQPGTIYGNITICEASSQIFSVTAVPNTSSYIWTLPNSWTGNSSTDSIQATIGSSGDTIRVKAVNSCGNSTEQKLVVTVTQIPVQPTITQNGNQLTSSATVGNQWYKHGVILSGSTGQNYTPTSSGNYTVQVTANNCSSAFSAEVNFIYTSVPDIDVFGNEVKVFPNPAKDQLIITRSGILTGLNIRLFDTNGRQLNTISSGSSRIEIDLRKYASGVYVVWVEDWRNKIRGRKIIVKL